MPQEMDTSIISFSVPEKNDSIASNGRIVHVAVVKPKVESTAELIITPLLIMLPMATILILILNKIKDGQKTTRVLSKLEKAATKIDDDIARGIM